MQLKLLSCFLLITMSLFAQNNSWIDASAPIDPATTPVYEGNSPIKFEFNLDMHKGDPVTLSSYSFGAHTGTHIDAPEHFIKDGLSVDKLPLEPFIGPAIVIDFPSDVTAITAAELNKHQWHGAKRVLLRTRSSHEGWIVNPKFRKDFPYLAPDAAQLLADAKVELVGIDYLSIEQFGAKVPKTHQILLGKNIPIIEGLDLRKVQAGNYDLIVLPLRVVGHEGAPARAVLRKR